jgi:hypothetical protein
MSTTNGHPPDPSAAVASSIADLLQGIRLFDQGMRRLLDNCEGDPPGVRLASARHLARGVIKGVLGPQSPEVADLPIAVQEAFLRIAEVLLNAADRSMQARDRLAKLIAELEKQLRQNEQRER